MIRQRLTGHVADWTQRNGAFMVFAAVILIGGLTFVGMSVDLGLISMTKTRMQAAADSAALAAAQEIGAAIQEIGEQGGGGQTVQQINAIAADAARDMAAQVVEMNGFYIDKQVDVVFGQRKYSSQEGFYTVWDSFPSNVVQVNIQMDNPDLSAPDAKLQLMFAPVMGDKSAFVTASATAFIEARDIVSVCDYSGSMNYDSLPWKSGLNQTEIRNNLDDCWNALVASDVRYSDDSGTKKFPAGGWGKIDSKAGTYYNSNNVNDVFDHLELSDSSEGVKFYDYSNYSKFMTKLGPGTYDLNNMPGNLDDDINSIRVPEGFTVTLWDFANQGGWQYGPVTSDVSSMGGYSNDAEWIVITDSSGSSSYEPYPQEGKDSNGNRKGKPNKTESEDLWKDYIAWVIDESNGAYDDLDGSGYNYKDAYGYRTLLMYMLSEERENDESEDNWRVPAYPFHAVKEGMTLFCGFLDGLGFGDQLGLCTYATTAQRAVGLWDDGAPVTVDLGTAHLTENYLDIDTIQRHKQAAHYSPTTNIGDGLKEARLLLEEQGRIGARHQILLMTDGAVNRPSSLPSLPGGWDNFDWNEMTDWDGDGAADYDNSDIQENNSEGYYPNQKKYVFYQAKLAVEQGMTIHTMAVGDGADWKMMKALATYGGGMFIHVPGGTSIENFEANLLQKFSVLAAMVPPAKLMDPDQ